MTEKDKKEVDKVVDEVKVKLTNTFIWTMFLVAIAFVLVITNIYILLYILTTILIIMWQRERSKKIVAEEMNIEYKKFIKEMEELLKGNKKGRKTNILLS